MQFLETETYLQKIEKKLNNIVILFGHILVGCISNISTFKLILFYFLIALKM